MIAAAFQYSGLGIILGMLLVTAVIVLCERRDHGPDESKEIHMNDNSHQQGGLGPRGREILFQPTAGDTTGGATLVQVADDGVPVTTSLIMHDFQQIFEREWRVVETGDTR